MSKNNLSINVDRYDARGALHDVASLEAPPGGFDWRVELTRSELDVEQLCDEERYRALHTNEDEEEMYKGDKSYENVPTDINFVLACCLNNEI